MDEIKPADPLTPREAEVSAMLILGAIVLTMLSLLTMLMTPFAVIAWMAVGCTMYLRPWYRKRRRLRESHG